MRLGEVKLLAELIEKKEAEREPRQWCSGTHLWTMMAMGSFVVQSLSRVQLFATPRTATHQASLSSTISQSLIKFMSIESVMPTNHLAVCHPLLLLPSIFPNIRILSRVSSSHQVAKVLELRLQHQWVPIAQQRAWHIMCWCSLSCVWLFVTPWTVAHRTPQSMRFSRQEYWSGLPFPSPGDLPNPGTESESLASLAMAGKFFTTEPPGKPLTHNSPTNKYFSTISVPEGKLAS